MTIYTYVENELLELSEETVAVIEHAVEAQNFAVHLQELTQLVEVGRSLRHLDRLAFNTSRYVRVSGTAFHFVDNNSFTFQPILPKHRQLGQLSLLSQPENFFTPLTTTLSFSNQSYGHKNKKNEF